MIEENNRAIAVSACDLTFMRFDFSIESKGISSLSKFVSVKLNDTNATHSIAAERPNSLPRVLLLEERGRVHAAPDTRPAHDTFLTDLRFISPTFYGVILVPGYMYTTEGPSTIRR